MPVFTFTSPDGKKYDVTGPEGATEQEAFALLQSQIGQQPSAEEELRNPQTGMRAGLDATRTLAQGAVAGPVSGLAGIAGAVLPGPEGQGADWQRKAQEFLSHQPQTPGSELLVNTATAPFQWLADRGNEVGGGYADLGQPALGAGINAVSQVVPALVGKGAQKPIGAMVKNAKTKLAGEASRNSVKDATYKAAVEEGYVVPPSEYNPTFVGNRIESVGGKAAIKQQAEIQNQQITNKIARRESGLGPDDPITEGSLLAARDKMAQPYAEVAALSPRAKVALEKLKQTRADAKVYWRHFDMQGDPASLTKARSLDQRAGAYERLIDAEAKRAGRPDLLPKLRQARESIAKNYTVDRSINVGDGNVDALMIGRIRDKSPHMTGGLKTIGDFANSFPRFARQESKVPASGVSKSEAIMGSLFAAGGGMALGPGGVALGTLPFIAPPIARAIALSGRGPRKYQPNAALRAAEATARAFPGASLIGTAQDQ